MSDPALGLGEYLIGAAELAIVIVALAFCAYRLCRAALPDFSGPPALVAGIVAWLTLAIVLVELLGTFGAFTEFGLVIGSIVLAGVTAVAAPRVAGRSLADAGTPPVPPGHRLGLAIVAVVVAAIFAGWAIPTLSGITSGMGRADSLWYHMPLAARFADTGSTGDLFFFDPIFFASFYPANSEILHAIPILAFDRDFLSPLLNLGFLAIGLVSGWAIGRPYGLAPQALLGAAVVLGAETMTDFQAGEALNDITGVAFLLACVAILVNGRAARPGGGVGVGALAFAGAAAGLAAGTKLSFLAPVAFLTVAIFIVSKRQGRVRATAAFSVPMLIAGGYWYLRNLIVVGNPIPYTTFGPLGLPAPERALELRPGFSVAHYWDQPGIWWDWFVPKLSEELGPLWPLVLAGTVVAGVLALKRGIDPLLRVLGGVAILTAIAYLFTPLTAGGEEGEPIAFEWNIRYLAPAVGIGLAILPLFPAFSSTPRRRSLSLFGFGALALATTLSIVQWPSGGHTKGALATGVLVLGIFAAGAWAFRHNWVGPRAPGRRVLGVGSAVALVVLAAGFVAERHYLERRYESLSPQLKIAEAVRWANTARDERIAISGIRGVFNQYAFSGPDLSNHVQWLGIEGDDSAFLRIPDCETWREEVNAGDYTYVVTMYDPYAPIGLTDTKEGLWTREDPGVTQVLRDGPVSVFRIDSKLDPAACGDLPALDEAELNGDSVNNEPLANQPPYGLSGGSGTSEEPAGSGP
ncbi:MAG: hypothetical protein M3355_03445 [Actinomycetota bacterium]|nr:hypothetical protein [Actinomycetota bacterium]